MTARCLTAGAVYEIEISPERVTISVEIPPRVKIEETDELKQRMHSAMEYALAPFFP